MSDDAAEAGRAESAAERAEAAQQAAGRAAGKAERAGAAAEEAEQAAQEIAEEMEADPVVDTLIRELEAGVDEQNPFGTLGRPLQRSPFLLGFAFALGAILAWVAYQAIVAVTSILVLIIVAGFLSIGLHPIVSRLERLGLRRGVAVGLVLILVLAFFIGVGYSVVPPIVKQVEGLVQHAPDYLNRLRHNGTLRHLDERFHILSRVQEATSNKNLSKAGTQTVGGVLGIGKAVLNSVFNGLTVLILTLYFVSAFDRIKNAAYRAVPRSRRARTVLIGDEMLARVGGYVEGAVIIAAIAGTSTLLWALFLGIPYPLALALLVAATDLIPLVGATIGAVLVTIVAFFVSWPVGVATLAFFLAYQQLENYLIYPRIMKRSVDVNPAAAIVAVLIGGGLLGIVGALLAIPVAAAVQLLMAEVVIPRQDAA